MDSQGGRQVGETLEALLLVPFLRPMIAGMSGVGDYELDLFAQSIAEHDAGGFADLVAHALEPQR